jgi:hypothetical protein
MNDNQQAVIAIRRLIPTPDWMKKAETNKLFGEYLLDHAAARTIVDAITSGKIPGLEPLRAAQQVVGDALEEREALKARVATMDTTMLLYESQIRNLKASLQQAAKALKRGRPQIIGILVQQDFDFAITEAEALVGKE